MNQLVASGNTEGMVDTAVEVLQRLEDVLLLHAGRDRLRHGITLAIQRVFASGHYMPGQLVAGERRVEAAAQRSPAFVAEEILEKLDEHRYPHACPSKEVVSSRSCSCKAWRPSVEGWVDSWYPRRTRWSEAEVREPYQPTSLNQDTSMPLELLKVGTLNAYVLRQVPAPTEPEPALLQSLLEYFATKSEAVEPISPSELPSSFHVGMPLNWDAPHVPVELMIELPFWLFIPSASSSFTITMDATNVEIEVYQDVCEISAGHQYRESRGAFTAYERISDTLRAGVLNGTDEAGRPVIYRALKTTLCIRTQALEDAIEAYTDTSTSRRQHALSYMQALAYAHLPIINRLIAAYQRASEDPFAHEVAEWQVPFWIMHVQDKYLGIPLVSYLTYDQYPYICDFAGVRTPIELASPGEVRAALAEESIPGHVELIEAWGYYYRGQFGDAIRLLTTAIEIALEAVFRKLLRDKGQSQVEIDVRLEQTFNDFERRLNDYLGAARRRLPGPMLSHIPVINGVRLKEELARNRKMRHKIVHEGLRFDRKMANSLQRVMETSTWLFKWLNEPAGRLIGRIPGRGVFQSLIGRPAFQWEYTSHGVRVQRPVPQRGVRAPLPAPDERHEQFMNSIEGDERDIELCVRMFFEAINARHHDAPPMPSGEICAFERFIIPMDSQMSEIPVFVFDLEAMPRVEHLHSVAARLIERISERRNGLRALCIFNCQSGAPWRLREQRFVEGPFIALARKCRITVLSTVDMLLTVDAMRRYAWSIQRVSEATFQLGLALHEPAGFQRIGSVRTFYAERRVLSINIDAGADIRRGDTIVVRMKDRYHEQAVDSLQENRADTQVVVGPGRAGVLVPVDRSVVLTDGGVFADPEKRPVK